MAVRSVCLHSWRAEGASKSPCTPGSSNAQEEQVHLCKERALHRMRWGVTPSHKKAAPLDSLLRCGPRQYAGETGPNTLYRAFTKVSRRRDFSACYQLVTGCFLCRSMTHNKLSFLFRYANSVTGIPPLNYLREIFSSFLE